MLSTRWASFKIQMRAWNYRAISFGSAIKKEMAVLVVQDCWLFYQKILKNTLLLPFS